jgi:hypothetical protein
MKMTVLESGAWWNDTRIGSLRAIEAETLWRGRQL